MRAASNAIGRNPTYLQQYIKYGKPDWLEEQDRDRLVQIYGLDPERLRQPPKPLPLPEATGSDRSYQSQFDTQRLGKFVDDPRALQLLRAWENIRNEENRLLVLRMAIALADSGAAGAVAA